MRTQLYGSLALVCGALIGATSLSFAQDNVPAAQPPRVVSSGGGITPTGQYQEGLPFGGWMLYPDIYAGYNYNSNFNQAASGTNRDSGSSVRVAPRMIATHTDGAIHSTMIFGVGDFQLFNNTTVSADAGISHNYKPTQDLTFNGNFRFTRETDLFSSALNFNNNAIGPSGTPSVPLPIVVNPFGTSPSVNPTAYNQFTGGVSAAKTFGEWFTSVSATAFHIAFDHDNNLPFPFNTSNDSTSLWLAGRVGYHFIPGMYAFVEGNGIWQRFENSLFDTNGYRVMGGIGTDDPNSLVRGEVFGGYQFQHQQAQTVFIPGTTVPFFINQDADSFVFGGRVYYYPTRFWTLVGSADQVVSMSSILSPGIPAGLPTRVTTVILQTTYGLSRQWSIGGRVGYSRTDYIGSFNGFNRLDNAWMLGASLNYEIWRNLALTLDYQWTTSDSNIPFNDFTKNVVSAGLTYRY